jgi:hypothetical protein
VLALPSLALGRFDLQAQQGELGSGLYFGYIGRGHREGSQAMPEFRGFSIFVDATVITAAEMREQREQQIRESEEKSDEVLFLLTLLDELRAKLEGLGNG